MHRLFRPSLFLLAATCLTAPAVAQQTPPTQGWPANKPPAAAPATPPAAGAKPPAAGAPAATTPEAPAQAGATPPAIPLPQWFVEIDVNKKGEVTRADFLKYRMKSFEQLDANKDNKLSLDEFNSPHLTLPKLGEQVTVYFPPEVCLVMNS